MYAKMDTALSELISVLYAESLLVILDRGSLDSSPHPMHIPKKEKWNLVLVNGTTQELFMEKLLSLRIRYDC